MVIPINRGALLVLRGSQVAAAGTSKKGGTMRGFLRLALAAGVLAGSMQLNAGEGVSISVRPTIASTNGSAQVKVLVARNERNRVLTWEIDGPNYYRSSAMQLDGASSPRSYLFFAHDLPEGSYDVRATVRRADESVIVDRCSIRVVEGGPRIKP